jgi:hypothetical protein
MLEPGDELQLVDCGADKRRELTTLMDPGSAAGIFRSAARRFIGWRRPASSRDRLIFRISPNRRIWYEDEIIAWQNAVDEFDPRRRRGKRRRQRVA